MTIVIPYLSNSFRICVCRADHVTHSSYQHYLPQSIGQVQLSITLMITVCTTTDDNNHDDDTDSNNDNDNNDTHDCTHDT